MAVVRAAVSQSNQMTLPSSIRKKLGIKSGGAVEFVDVGQHVILRRAETQEEAVKRLFQELDEWREQLPQNVKDNIKKRAGWTVNQYHGYFDNLPENVAKRKEKYGI